MYGLPKDADLRFFIGSTLTQICIGANEVIFRFDNDADVTVEGDLSLVGVEGTVATHKSAGATGRAVIDQIGRSVVEVDADYTTGTLKLKLSSGIWIFAHDSFPHCESYQIRKGDARIVV